MSSQYQEVWSLTWEKIAGRSGDEGVVEEGEGGGKAVELEQWEGKWVDFHRRQRQRPHLQSDMENDCRLDLTNSKWPEID